MMDSIEARVEWYRDRLNDASGRWGGVEICAVTKTRSAEEINRAYDAGVRTIGENRVQELMQKFPALNPGFTLHLIGQLQSNKVKYIMDKVSMVQSVDRASLAREISLRAARAGRAMDVLVEVNIAGEASKGGVPEAELSALLEEASRMEGLRLRGLMAVMPLAEDPEAVRGCFRRMRAHFDRARDGGLSLDCLSMGMSGDCFVAAQEGATMVRLGTALFGRRE